MTISLMDLHEALIPVIPDDPSRRDSYDKDFKGERFTLKLNYWNVPVQAGTDLVVVGFITDNISYNWNEDLIDYSLDNPSVRFPSIDYTSGDDTVVYPSIYTVPDPTGITYPTTLGYPNTLTVPAGTYVNPGIPIVTPFPIQPNPFNPIYPDEPKKEIVKEPKKIKIDIDKILDGLKGLEIEEDDWTALGLSMTL